ncbi:MAG: haloacid dehalogenase type II [bacterium]|nr:haloacid dehalogenase type II [bacterium]
MPSIPNIKACVFDAYGTLFDVHSAAGKHRTHLGDEADQVSTLWRTKQLEYTWLRSLMQHHIDFWQITQDALDYALETAGIEDQTLRTDLIEAYLHLDAYPDVPDVLDHLKTADLQTAILSNGSPHMLEAAVKNSGLESRLDHILSVEEIGIFKPDPRVYQLACDRLSVHPEEILFHSSNAWDAHGASAFGLRVAWINRFHQRPERLPGAPDVECSSLADIPNLLGI